MLDETNACRLRELLNEYNPLYKDETSTYRERAFNEILECLGMILKEYEHECDEMAKWYEEQERKMVMERQRISKEKVKSIAYIEVYDNGEFELEKLPSLIRLVDGDDFDVLDFVPSFVIPISLESPTEIPNS